eukprot:7747230-Pyramimonas_sp.AAC.1
MPPAMRPAKYPLFRVRSPATNGALGDCVRGSAFRQLVDPRAMRSQCGVMMMRTSRTMTARATKTRKTRKTRNWTQMMLIATKSRSRFSLPVPTQ